MLIRLARPNELKIIRSYAKKVQQEATLGYIKPTDHSPNKDGYFFNNTYYFVLINNNELCGWILVGEMINPINRKPTGMILELYVFQNYRKKGFGHKLMKYALAHLKNRGFESVQLNVYEGNPAQSLYEKFGFKNISTIMEKHLND